VTTAVDTRTEPGNEVTTIAGQASGTGRLHEAASDKIILLSSTGRTDDQHQYSIARPAIQNSVVILALYDSRQLLAQSTPSYT